MVRYNATGVLCRSVVRRTVVEEAGSCIVGFCFCSVGLRVCICTLCCIFFCRDSFGGSGLYVTFRYLSFCYSVYYHHPLSLLSCSLHLHLHLRARLEFQPFLDYARSGASKSTRRTLANLGRLAPTLGK